MVTGQSLGDRRDLVVKEGDLPALLRELAERAQPLLDRMPPVPRVKAMLSTDGGVCPACGAALRFDPWEAERHRCSACALVATGERHHAHWARAQHLWLSERAAHLAAVGVFAADERYARRARELMRAYHELYFELPNQDNVLGPSHLFFSTYLESMWVLNYLAAAQLLRERGWLPEEDVEAVSRIADEAAAVIGGFDEGMSNRQTWNAAALTAIAVWFGDQELAGVAIQGPTGLLGHLTDGFAEDGLWYEGENYHLFAMRGLLMGLHWARSAGVDLLTNPELADHFGLALMAPAATALPDLTFPARRDARFGVSLAHPASLECWEAGLAALGEAAPAALAPWLHQLYRTPHRPAATYDAYLHDAGAPERSATARCDLSWWMLLAMAAELPPDTLPWEPASALLPSQGVAVLRQHGRYVSLECGADAGGHGHPDRLHLTLHADGVHWLADPGTGSYVSRDLFWYRSTLAHNAPRQDGESQPSGPANCLAFEDAGTFGWIQGRFGNLRRSVVQGPGWLVDAVDREGSEERLLELPWHFLGNVEVESAGQWKPIELSEEFLRSAEVFETAERGPIRVVARVDDRALRAFLLGGTLIRAECPGRPGAEARATALLLRTRSPAARLAAVLDFTGGIPAAALAGDEILVGDATAAVRVRIGEQGVVIQDRSGSRTLGGARPVVKPPRRLMAERPEPVTGEAVRVDEPPALDGTLEGFDLSAPIELADELHYRRSEEPYEGPELFSAVGFVNWDEEAVYLAVQVTKSDVAVRAPDEPPLGLDNEPDDIHSDGIQIYLRRPGDLLTGYLIRPADDGGVWARPIPGEPTALAPLAGGASLTEDGYVITVAFPCPGLQHLRDRPELEFELVVNEMRPGRIRRAGQLAWGGGGGWVYLRGDRCDPAQLGILRLVG